jgi:hypothetical protein
MPPTWSGRRNGALAARLSFKRAGEARSEALRQVLAALRRAGAARHRVLAAKARDDVREWEVKRRERTRQLIELGGLVAKAGLVELTDDDRAVIFGALLQVARKLRDEDREQALALWRRAGQRAFREASIVESSSP